MPVKSSLVERVEQRLQRELITLPALPDEVVAQLHEQLGVPTCFDNRIDMELRLTAWLYRNQTPQEDTTDRAARRKRMRAMAKGLASTLAAHEAMDAGDLHRIVSASSDARLEDFLTLADQLRKWAPVFQELAKAKLPKGLEGNDRLASCCRRLVHLYEEVTGQTATHTSLDKGGMETDEPQTSAGRFVWTFFGWLDPQAQKQVRETLRKIIWPSRTKKRIRAESQ